MGPMDARELIVEVRQIRKTLLDQDLTVDDGRELNDAGRGPPRRRNETNYGSISHW
jgi:hypothetical protein